MTARPFFAVPDDGSPVRGRLLLMSYEFPPGASAGALRWQRFAGHAAALGWRLDVVTVDPSSLPSKEIERLEELPPGTRVYGIPPKRLLIDKVEQVVWNAISRLRRLLQRNADIPPGGSALSRGGAEGLAARAPSRRRSSLGRSEIQRLRWTPRVFVRVYYALLLLRREERWSTTAGQVARKIVAEGGHRAIISCGPPHLPHLTASVLARDAGLPHIVDMRDPWSLVERLPEVIGTSLWYWRASRWERRVVSCAALLVANTEPAADSLRRLYPEAAGRCVTVMNGYDEDPIPTATRGARFVVAYAGSIYLDRDPRGLFRAAARVVRERALTPDSFGIEFMGSAERYNGLTLEEIADEEGIAEYVRVHAHRPRQEALEFLASAAMLVCLPQDSRMAIPSKVFEYMRYDAWLLAMTDPGTATERLLAGSGADVVSPDDVDGIARVLELRIRQYTETGAPRQPALVPTCSRVEQARRFFVALEGVLRPREPTAGTAAPRSH